MENSICKYCYEKNNLIYPCNCKYGVHLECLQKWLKYKSSNNIYICEICNTDLKNIINIYINKNYYKYFSYENFIKENTI